MRRPVCGGNPNGPRRCGGGLPAPSRCGTLPADDQISSNPRGRIPSTDARIAAPSSATRVGRAAQPAEQDFRYDAFVSYSRAFDARVGPAIQRGLMNFARPWNRARALRVFRDETSLSANPSVWSSIEVAILDSRYFVLLASPATAASVWVRRELACWRANRSTDQLLIVLTDGVLHWDEERGDFDWPCCCAGWTATVMSRRSCATAGTGSPTWCRRADRN